MRSKLACALLWAFVSGMLSQNLPLPVISTSTDDQKSYYSPHPHPGTPPEGSHHSPPHGHGGTPPTDKNCGNPPHEHPSTPTTPSHPPSGGDGQYNPPSSGGGSPPTTPVTDPGTPSTPTTPIIGTPSTPTTPIIGTPSTPTIPIIGTCNFWKNHPGMIWGVLGWWGTLGNAFGATNVPGFGANLNLLQALSNTRTDGFGALFREGTASYLNSLVNDRFPFTTKQVRGSFVAALASDTAAADQAEVFKMANEGKLKPRA